MKKIEAYIQSNHLETATPDMAKILAPLWVKSPETVKKLLNNPRKFNEIEIVGLVKAYLMDSDLAELYLNTQLENGEFRFDTYELPFLVEAHKQDVNTTQKYLNEKLDNGNFRFNGKEIYDIVSACQIDASLTDFFLNIKLDDGAYRFNPKELTSLINAYKQNPELVKDLLTQEYYKGQLRHKSGQHIVDAVEAQKRNPQRFQELLEEQFPPPHEYIYMYDGSDILSLIRAEEIDFATAQKLKAQTQEGGLPRFSAHNILLLTEVYKKHPQTLDKIMNIKNVNGVYKFFNSEKGINDLVDLLITCEKYPEILEIAEQNESIIGDKALSSLCIIYETEPQLTKTILNLKNPNGLSRFKISDVSELIEANKINPTMTQELLDYKTEDGNAYRFSAIEIKGLVNAHKQNPDLTKQLLTQKNSKGKLFQGITIVNIVESKETSPEIFDYAIQCGFSIANASIIVNAVRDSRDPDLVKLLMGYKNSEGKNKFNGNEIFALAQAANGSPYVKSKILDYLDNNYKCMTILGLIEVEKTLSKDEFEKLNNSLKKVMDFVTSKNINYHDLALLTDKTFLVELDKERNSYILFDSNGERVQGGYFDESNENFHKVGLYRQTEKQEMLARIEHTTLGNEDCSFYTENIKTVKDANGNLLYKEFCLKSKDVEGKFDIWREEPNGKKYKIGLAEKTPAGDIVLEKTLVAIDGTKTDYNYMQSPNGSRLVYTKITEPDGKITENKQQFKVIDDTHSISIENDVVYIIEYEQDKIVVTKENGEKVELTIGSNDRDSEGIISKDLLPLIKMLPGSALCDIKEFELTKIWLNNDISSEGNAAFVPSAGKIEVSKRNATPEMVFILLHELGHYRDYFKFRENKELNKIFEEEYKAFDTSATRIEGGAISYLLTTGILKPGGMQKEFIAETNAIMHSANFAPFVEMRGQYLQKYFPRTFAKVVELLKESGVQKYTPEP